VSTDDFFKQQREQSEVKAAIVEKYFHAWASIVSSGHGRDIAYVDLFAGPGRYEDGSSSTPLRVLGQAIEKGTYVRRLRTLFNDRDSTNVASLQGAIRELPGIDQLKHQPVVLNEEIDSSVAREFERRRDTPTLMFIDPWGYKGLTLNLIHSAVRDWACECIFFFNYNRINPGISNAAVFPHMAALFGEDQARRLGDELDQKSPRERESRIVEALATALKGGQDRLVLPFCFKNQEGTRTSHHLFLVTKSFKGYDTMKGIMANASSSSDQGVPSFTYCPADFGQRQGLLFSLNAPLAALRGHLRDDRKGQTWTMGDLYKKDSVDRPYLRRNYVEVLKEMEKAGELTVTGRKSNQGFPDYLTINFVSR